MRRFFAFIFGIALLLSPLMAGAQETARPFGPLPAESSPAVSVASGPLRVYLVTFGPGADPWEKFGHDCIVIESPDSSVAYNWGVFDFGQGTSGFLTFAWHFLQGRLLYSMQSDPTGTMLDAYQAAGRSILVEELQLTQVQKMSLRDHLQASDTEANRYYLYDYFRKNCTTMARDAIDQVVDGRIEKTLKQIPAETTLRWHDRRATADQLWLYLFLDFQLGHAVDRPLSAYDECFLPGVLARRISAVQVPDDIGAMTGEMRSIVISQKLLSPGTFGERQVPPSGFIYGFAAFGLVTGALFYVLAIAGARWRAVGWIFVLGVIGWSLFVGLFGALDTFAWFTNHEAAKWNENWLQGNPLSLLMIVLAPMAFRWPVVAKRVAWLIFGMSTLGLIAKLTPWFWQVNGDIIAGALPVHAGIALGIARLVDRRKKQLVPASPADVVAINAN